MAVQRNKSFMYSINDVVSSKEPVNRPPHRAPTEEEKRNQHVVRLLAEFKTTAELALNPPPQTEWYAPRVFAKGAMTMVAGPPKGGGKTTFVLSALSQILTGGLFLGEHCMYTPVVYVTEQSRGTFENEYLERYGLMGRNDFYVLYGYACNGAPWGAFVEALVQQCQKANAGILVIDTLAKFAQFKDENDASEMQRIIDPLMDASAKLALTVILIHHTRKSGGEAYDAGRGSGAFAAAMDVLISLQPLDQETRPVLTIGRFTGLLPDECRIKQEGATYRYIGEGKSSVFEAKLEDVLTMLRNAEPNAWFTVKQVAERQQIDKNTASKYLNQLKELGKVECQQMSTKGNSSTKHYRAVRNIGSERDHTDSPSVTAAFPVGSPPIGADDHQTDDAEEL